MSAQQLGREDGSRPKQGAKREHAPADLLWAVALLSVIVILLLRNFVWEAGAFGEVRLGALRLSIFGLLSVLDLFFGVYLVKRWCERFELDWATLSIGLPWIILVGYYVSHLVSVAFYFPQELLDWQAVLDPRTRISSFGGMFGGAVVAVAFLRRRGLPIRRYGDALTLGFVGGYVFGRAGCFAIHDHPGRMSDFALAVDIAGVRRHDLGFYEMGLMLALLIAILVIARRRRPPDGLVFAFAATVYAPIRFAFDFLRIDDVRYAGLTPGQWFALPMFAAGLLVWGLIATRRSDG